MTIFIVINQKRKLQYSIFPDLYQTWMLWSKIYS